MRTQTARIPAQIVTILRWTIYPENWFSFSFHTTVTYNTSTHVSLQGRYIKNLDVNIQIQQAQWYFISLFFISVDAIKKCNSFVWKKISGFLYFSNVLFVTLTHFLSGSYRQVGHTCWIWSINNVRREIYGHFAIFELYRNLGTYLVRNMKVYNENGNNMRKFYIRS